MVAAVGAGLIAFAALWAVVQGSNLATHPLPSVPGLWSAAALVFLYFPLGAGILAIRGAWGALGRLATDLRVSEFGVDVTDARGRTTTYPWGELREEGASPVVRAGASGKLPILLLPRRYVLEVPAAAGDLVSAVWAEGESFRPESRAPAFRE